MYKYEDQKEMRRAINGRMVVMAVGLFLIITAVTTTLLQGIQFFFVANAAGKGDKAALDLLSQTSLTVGQIYGLAATCTITAIAQIMVGVICTKFCNRLDKVKICLYADCVLLVVMLLQQVHMMIINKMFSVLPLISGLLMPLVLLWGITRLRMLAKKYPDRTYAVETSKVRSQKAAASQNKNLMARAKAQVKDEKKVSRIVDEIQDTTEE